MTAKEFTNQKLGSKKSIKLTKEQLEKWLDEYYKNKTYINQIFSEPTFS